VEAGRRRVCDICEKGMDVNEVFSVRKKDPPRKGKNAGHFFSLNVTDATGEIRVNFWGGPDEALVRRTFESIREGEVVRIRGVSGQWEDSMVLQVNHATGGSIRAARPDEYALSELIPCTDKDPQEMMAEVRSYIEGMRDPDIRGLLERMFSDRAFAESFSSSPASVSWHCAWVGGLLEHTLNVLRICDHISQLYSALDRDLLLASAILHDVGKVRCYNVSTTIAESVDGRLKGHIVIGAQMVEDACSSFPDFPGPLRAKLVHMVLASHGSNDKGSPVGPALPEAVALNYADEIDARLERFIIARDSGGPDDVFVMDPKLRTKVFTG